MAESQKKTRAICIEFVQVHNSCIFNGDCSCSGLCSRKVNMLGYIEIQNSIKCDIDSMEKRNSFLR